MHKITSCSPSPASDAPAHDDHPTPTDDVDGAEPAQDAPTPSREDSAAAHRPTSSPDDAPSPSASRSASELPPAASPAEPHSATSASVHAPAAESSASGSAVPTGSWQAVFSPSHNAYYFYNSVTHETTWTNPLQSAADAGPSGSTDEPSDPAGASSSSTPGAAYDIYAAAAAQGIDPALAHLDPSLAASSSSSAGSGAFAYTAKFNARTGAFTRPDGRDPTHLSEYERAKRMSEFYFDVGAWERDVEQRKLEEAQEEADGKKRKRPTKKDLVSAPSPPSRLCLHGQMLTTLRVGTV